ILDCNASKIIAKLCQVSGLTVDKPDEQCVSQELKPSVDHVINFENITNLPMVLEMTVKDASVKVHVKLTKSINSSDDDLYTTFDLNNPKFAKGTFNDDNHKYTGFKLAAAEFKLQDLGWSSETFKDDGCFSNPTLMCSFAQNYADGRVPINENVMPWYSTSAFAIGKYTGCSVKFLYNGCDNSTSSNGCSSSDKGKFYEDGVELNNNDSVYKFSKEGLHGYYETERNLMGTTKTGLAYDAKVKMSCTGADVPSSLINAKSCGEFYVGATVPCSENIDLVKNVEYCSGDKCVIDLGGSKNLRDAAVNFVFDEYNMSGTIAFMDERNNESMVADISSKEQKIEISSLKNSSFDPQLVRYIVVRPNSGARVNINYAGSACPNALNISNCTAEYNGSRWNLGAKLTSGDQCRVKSITDGGTDESQAVKSSEWSDWKSCSNPMNISVAEDLSGIESSKKYQFEYSIRKGSDDSNIATCRTDVVDVQALTAICGDVSDVAAGEVPSFSFRFAGCPSSGVSYTVEVGDQSSGTKTSDCKSGLSWAPQNLAAGNYTYKLKVG
ncbi:MAG: hypothetical protein HUK20_02115, partial [Fibrobacter sp.]|nr:hypothetical protein [Fibrobacter sp.]